MVERILILFRSEMVADREAAGDAVGEAADRTVDW
jgi:hypothetical protein